MSTFTSLLQNKFYRLLSLLIKLSKYLLFTKRITKLSFNINITANSMVILLNEGTNIFGTFLLFVIGLAFKHISKLHYFPFPKTHFKICRMLPHRALKETADTFYLQVFVHILKHRNSYYFSMSVSLGHPILHSIWFSSKVCWGVLAERIALHAWIYVLRALWLYLAYSGNDPWIKDSSNTQIELLWFTVSVIHG